MKALFHHSVRILAFVVLTLLLTGLQTTLWYQIFGNFPPPMLWLIPCLYLSLYRNQLEALLSDYLIAFAVSPFTVMPVGLLLMILMVLTISGAMLKNRIYWKGARVFSSYCFFSVIAFQILYTLLSWFFEEKSIIIDWALAGKAVQVALSFLVSFPLYYVFSFLDDVLGSPEAPDLELQK